jgi:hypothetical protein
MHQGGVWSGKTFEDGAFDGAALSDAEMDGMLLRPLLLSRRRAFFGGHSRLRVRGV